MCLSHISAGQKIKNKIKDLHIGEVHFKQSMSTKLKHYVNNNNNKEEYMYE